MGCHNLCFQESQEDVDQNCSYSIVLNFIDFWVRVDQLMCRRVEVNRMRQLTTPSSNVQNNCNVKTVAAAAVAVVVVVAAKTRTLSLAA